MQEVLRRRMKRIMLVMMVLAATAEGNVFIRTRITPASESSYITLSIPPYSSNFHRGSKGLSHDLIEMIEQQIAETNGSLSEPDPYDVELYASVGPGSPALNTGLYGAIKDRHAQFGVGPFAKNFIHHSKDVVEFGTWLDVHLSLIVDNQSKLAQALKEQQLVEDRIFRGELISNQVQVILVENSAEHIFLNNTRNIIPNAYLSLFNWLKKPGNHPVLVSSLCEGLKLLEDETSEKIAERAGGSVTRTTAALVTTELMANHYALGKNHLKLIPLAQDQQRENPLMVYSFIAAERSFKSHQIDTAMHRLAPKVRSITWKWMQYDEHACNRLHKALTAASTNLLSRVPLVISAFLLALYVNI